MLPSEAVDAGGHTSSHKDRDENEGTEQGQAGQQNHRNWKKYRKASFLAQNDCTFSLTQPGIYFTLLHGHLAMLWFEEGWDIFPALLQKDSHHPAAFTIKVSVPILRNMSREPFSHQEKQIPLSLH